MTNSECIMYETAKKILVNFLFKKKKKEGIWEFYLGVAELIMIWKCDCCHAYHLKGERKTFYHA